MSTQNSNETQSWLPGLGLSQLSEDRREKVKEVLFSEYDAFAKHENDIGKINNSKLKG